eukprot:7937210-Alexandrium_andersonii.AAC.2
MEMTAQMRVPMMAKKRGRQHLQPIIAHDASCSSHGGRPQPTRLLFFADSSDVFSINLSKRWPNLSA